MSKIYLLIFILTQFIFSQKAAFQDTVKLLNGTEYTCFVKEARPAFIVIKKEYFTKYEALTDIKEIILSDLGKIYEREEGYLNNLKKIHYHLLARNFKSRRFGLILGGGFRIVDKKIQEHMGGFSGPLFITLGFDIPLRNLPLNLEFVGEGGMGGQIQNSYSETYTYIDFRIGIKWFIPHKHEKINLMTNAGLKYISATIDDDADGNPDEFIFNSNVNFKEGTLVKSASGLGPFLDIGVRYNFSRKWSMSGLFHLSFINLDFDEFSTNALGPGFGVRITYYPGSH